MSIIRPGANAVWYIVKSKVNNIEIIKKRVNR